MKLSPGQIAEALKRVATGSGAAEKFSVARARSAGEPILWQEKISLALGGQAGYSTLRSFVDAGGVPIGVWDAPAEGAVVQAVATALLESKFWELGAEPMAPGAEVTTWSCATRDGDFALSANEGADLFMQMARVDLELRRSANSLVASGNGAALSCGLELANTGRVTVARISLANEGRRDCQIQNPLKGEAGPNAFLRLELGPLPRAEHGVTGPDVAFAPLPLPEIKELVAPWDQPVLVLRAGEKLACPFKHDIATSDYEGHYVRAVYSHYGTAILKPELPRIRGRVFSVERQLKG